MLIVMMITQTYTRYTHTYTHVHDQINTEYEMPKINAVFINWGQLNIVRGRLQQSSALV